MNNEMQYEEILWELEEVEKLDLENSFIDFSYK